MTEPPLAWNSTANSMEVYSFLAADSLLAIDDFVPRGNDGSRALNDKADQFVRAQGERIGWVDGENLYLLPRAAHKIVRTQEGL